MELKEIRKEIESLPNVEENLKNFQESWIKVIKNNTNEHLPFLRGIDETAKQEINKRLLNLHDSLHWVKESQIINQKLMNHSHSLVELKLTTFNGDENKSKMLTNSLLNDDFMSIKRTIREIKRFDHHVGKLQSQYNEVNDLLSKHLTLEEALYFMELPHYKYLMDLIKTAQKQKKITRDLGRHLVSLTKQTQLRKKK